MQLNKNLDSLRLAQIIKFAELITFREYILQEERSLDSNRGVSSKHSQRVASMMALAKIGMTAHIAAATGGGVTSKDGKWDFGTTSECPWLKGLMSKIQRHVSSSYNLNAGARPFIISQNIQPFWSSLTTSGLLANWESTDSLLLASQLPIIDSFSSLSHSSLSAFATKNAELELELPVFVSSQEQTPPPLAAPILVLALQVF